jgi:predicted RNase H-like HicB family nuclease
LYGSTIATTACINDIALFELPRMEASMQHKFVVTAEWDDEAGVWVATSDDIPGLVTEAVTLDALLERVEAVAPELLVDNADLPTPSRPSR